MTNFSGSSIPQWPHIGATIDTAGNGEVTVNGKHEQLPPANSTDAARQHVITYVAGIARKLGRPVRVIAQSPEGTWLLIIHPDETVHSEAPEKPAKPSRFQKRSRRRNRKREQTAQSVPTTSPTESSDEEATSPSPDLAPQHEPAPVPAPCLALVTGEETDEFDDTDDSEARQADATAAEEACSGERVDEETVPPEDDDVRVRPARHRQQIALLAGAAAVLALLAAGTAALGTGQSEGTPAITAQSQSQSQPADPAAETSAAANLVQPAETLAPLPLKVTAEVEGENRAVTVKLAASHRGAARWVLRGPAGRVVTDRRIDLGTRPRAFRVTDLRPGTYRWSVEPVAAGKPVKGTTRVSAPAPPTRPAEPSYTPPPAGGGNGGGSGGGNGGGSGGSGGSGGGNGGIQDGIA